MRRLFFLVFLFCTFFAGIFCPALFAQGDAAPQAGDDTPAEKPRLKLEPVFMAAGGYVFFFRDDSSLESDAAPILPAFHLNLSFPVWRAGYINIYLGLSGDVYSTHYMWSETLARPLPAGAENRRALVYGFPLGIAANLRFNLLQKLALCASLGATADLRLTLLAEDLNPSDPLDAISAECDKIGEYFFNDMHWLYIEAGIGADYKFSEKYSIEFQGRILIPVSAPSERQGETVSFLGARPGAGFRVIRRF